MLHALVRAGVVEHQYTGLVLHPALHCRSDGHTIISVRCTADFLLICQLRVHLQQSVTIVGHEPSTEAWLMRCQYVVKS